MPRRRIGIGVSPAAALAVLLVACGPESEAPSPSPGRATASPVGIPSISPSEVALAFPPTAEAEIAAIFDPLLEPYGLRLSRAALLSTTAPYEESETGRFLGLYVEPVSDEYEPADYLENLVPVGRLMITLAFQRWPGLEAVDVCQEPPPDIDDSETPTPETQLQVSREAAAALPWEELELSGLIAAARSQDPPGVVLRVSSRLSREPIWRDAGQEADTP